MNDETARFRKWLHTKLRSSHPPGPVRHEVHDRMLGSDCMRLVDARDYAEPLHLRLAVVLMLEHEKALELC